MTAPTYPWPTALNSAFADDAPFNETRARGLRDGIEHVRSVLYDPSAHVPAAQHDHDGINSALIQAPGPNLVERSSINDESWGGQWTKSAGVSIGNDAGDAGAHMLSSGDYVYVPLGSSDLDPEDCVGAGARFAVSVFVKRVGAVTAGTLTFGLTDASASTFMTGCKGTITYDLVTTSYQRFWFPCLTTNPATSCWFLALVGTTFTDEIRVDCVAVTSGPRLGWWHPADCDPTHYRHRNISQNVACWDSAVGMSSARQVVPT